MNKDLPITQWITGLKAGDSLACQRLWDQYFHRLIGVARSHLGLAARGGSDAEDVAQSVFKSLCLGAAQGKYPDVTDRDNLWTLLVAMTAFKSRDLLRHAQTLKRGGGRVLNECAQAMDEGWAFRLEDLVASEPTPDFAAEMIEECELLLARLNQDQRRTAELKLQGFTNKEIAAQMNCGERTVERRLNAVRFTWSLDIPD